MVRLIAAQVCTFAPMTNFEWQRSATDDGGKWELFAGGRRLQSVWKSGSRYGTLMGTTPGPLAEAKQEAEAAARAMISSEHQERLAGLGDDTLDDIEQQDDDEERDAPSM